LLVVCKTIPATFGQDASMLSDFDAMRTRLLDVASLLVTQPSGIQLNNSQPGAYLTQRCGSTEWLDGRLQGLAVVSYVHPRLPPALSDLRAKDIILRSRSNRPLEGSIAVAQDSACIAIRQVWIAWEGSSLNR